MKYQIEIIKERISTERKRLKISQEEFAKDYLFCGVASLKDWERKKCERIPPIDILFAMCKEFGCELAYLLGEINCKTQTATDIQAATGLNEAAQQAITNIENKALLNEYFTIECDKPNEFTYVQDEAPTAFQVMLSQMEMAKVEMAHSSARSDAVEYFIDRLNFLSGNGSYPVTADMIKHLRKEMYNENASLLFEKIIEKEI